MKIIVKCDNCGKLFERGSYEINRSKQLGRSTNCSRYCGAVSSNKKSTRTGDVKNLGKLARKDELTPFRHFIRSYKSRAKMNKTWKIPFELTIQDLFELWNKQKGLCSYTGYKLIHPYENKGKQQTPYLASIDRIDSTKGYVKDNIEFVCLVINYAKNKFLKDDIINFFSKINNNRSMV